MDSKPQLISINFSVTLFSHFNLTGPQSHLSAKYSYIESSQRFCKLGNSLMVQLFRLHFEYETMIRSMVKELRSHVPLVQPKKKEKEIVFKKVS